MAQALRLECFDRHTAEPAPEPPASPALGYEDGFATGREAGLAEAQEEQARLTEDVALKFSELAFTLEEARSGVLASLEPMLRGLVDTLVPELARASLSPWVVEAIMDAARADSRAPIALLVSEEAHAALSAIAEQQKGLRISVDATATLGGGEVLIRTPERETMLDLDRLVTEIGEALQNLFTEPTTRVANE
ncbi:hypothetical protein [Pelagovum pacificum]|uniref:Flagellar biosynthesis protein n=1 Tax=Pelagovum pacificum TaxID=2588711 RepID=A0A5C5GGL3_9RHOB|nr:hypothetical protein [Pelagovum pacificum]QQA42967.1 hypothetical protein I8N54_19720 [Pelagovum pacificum]TNY33888.1 hypothetical protein FHY64_11675 [Pelagovum pacificum]